MQVIIIILALLFVFLPQFWVKKVFAKYQKDTSNIRGTGGELALHLLKKLAIKDVKVLEGATSDSYDPQAKKLHLNSKTYNGKSLCAITIVAHEIGHVIQDCSNNILLRARIFFVKLVQNISVVGSTLLILSPLLFVFRPGLGFVALFFYLGTALLNVLVHLLTLPLEWDASFSKALPLLVKGKYITKKQLPAAREILTAAVFTYLAAALSNIFFVTFNWKRLLRR